MSEPKDIDRIKSLTLEESVINAPSEEVARVYKELGNVAFTARALGLACRYRDPETVKILVESGATFKYDKTFFKENYSELFNAVFTWCFYDFSKFLIKQPGPFTDRIIKSYVKNIKDENGQRMALASDKERVGIVEYLCRHAREAGFDPGDLLYYMIVTDDKKIVSVLKNNGVTLSEEKKKLVERGEPVSYLIQKKDPQDIVRILSELISETGGKKPRITDKMWQKVGRRFAETELSRFFIDNFDLSNMNKSKLIRGFILKNNVVCLEIAAELGWLKQPKKRDEMIAFAVDNGSTECTAYLLDYKNCTADLAAEREKAERKLERELNAAPDSAAVLSRFWSFKKKEDGTIIITGYKGDKTEIIVPEKIGGIPVTAIGERAFSPNAPRITEEQAVVRCRITKITVPPSVKVIGAEAFGGSGVCKGNFNAFSLLEEVTLPNSLEVFADKTSAENAPIFFVNCKSLTVKIPHSPYAEIFCRKNKVNYIFKEENNNG